MHVLVTSFPESVAPVTQPYGRAPSRRVRPQTNFQGLALAFELESALALELGKRKSGQLYEDVTFFRTVVPMGWERVGRYLPLLLDMLASRL